MSSRKGWASAAAALIAAAPAGRALAQGPPPASPVRYTEARAHEVQRSIDLQGSVESGSVSVVASEVEGLVGELLGREGETVRKGQPLARLRSETVELRLRATSAQLEEAEAFLKLAELTLKRSRELFEQNVASQQDLDEALYNFNARHGRVEQLAAEVARLRLDLERGTIKAPFAGVVAAERTEVGQWIGVGSPVVELISLADLEVRVEVPERYFSNLSRSARATVTFDAVPGLEVAGRVSAIVPRADPQARTFPLKVRLPGHDGRIGAGMLAKVSLPMGESFRATVVPKDAVVSEGPERIVYVINGDDTVARVAVSPRQGVGSWVVVEGALQPGQKVVTRGNERLRPGMPVKGEPLEYRLP